MERIKIQSPIAKKDIKSVLLFLKAQEHRSFGVHIEEITFSTEINRHSLGMYLNQLRKFGYIHRVRRGFYKITDKGTKALQDLEMVSCQ